MSLMFGDNISYLGKKPLDNRAIFKTIEEMKNFSDNYLPSLSICQNEEDGNLYVYNEGNDEDEVTGKWRLFEGNDEGNEVIFLTQEEYDELPEEKKEDGTVYSIIGEESGDPKAAFRNPDWSRASTTKISVSGTYTIPEDGIIIFNRITSPNGSTIANFTVNGVGFDMGTNDSGYKGRSAMVAKGDIVEWSGLEMIESPEYTFVPYKIVVTDTKIATNYSTDEVATGMYWIDGKPIYRKVLKATSNSVYIDNTWAAVQGITDTFMAMKSQIKMIKSTTFFSDISSSVVDRIEMRYADGFFETMVQGGAATAVNFGIVLEYTKIT